VQRRYSVIVSIICVKLYSKCI